MTQQPQQQQEPIHIRPALPSDIPRLINYAKRLFSETEHMELDNDVITRAITRAVMQQQQQQQQEQQQRDSDHYGTPLCATIYLVSVGAASNNPPIGTFMLTKDYDAVTGTPITYFQSVYVEKEYRGQRIFSRVYSHVVESVKPQPVRLYVNGDNESAIKAYLRLGMKPTTEKVFGFAKKDTAAAAAVAAAAAPSSSSGDDVAKKEQQEEEQVDVNSSKQSMRIRRAKTPEDAAAIIARSKKTDVVDPRGIAAAVAGVADGGALIPVEVFVVESHPDNKILGYATVMREFYDWENRLVLWITHMQVFGQADDEEEQENFTAEVMRSLLRGIKQRCDSDAEVCGLRVPIMTTMSSNSKKNNKKEIIIESEQEEQQAAEGRSNGDILATVVAQEEAFEDEHWIIFSSC